MTRMNYIMQIFVAVLLILSVSMPAGAGEAAEKTGVQKEHNVVARVNGVEIDSEDVEMMAWTLEPERSGEFGGERTAGDIRKEALEKLVMSELLYQKSRSLGLGAGPGEIDEALIKLKTRLGGDDGFDKFLEGQGITEEDVKVQLERSISIRNLMEKKIFEGIDISEEELKKAYEQDKNKYSRPERIVAVDVIFFLRPEDPASAAKAGEILKYIEDDPGKDPWVLVPDGTFIVRELDIKKENNAGLYEAAKGLETGRLSGVLTAEGSLHIIKIKEHTPFKQYSFEEARNAVAREIRQKEQKERLKQWEIRLKKEAKIEILNPDGGSDISR